MKKSFLCLLLAVVVITLSFSGCGNLVYTFGLSEIQYDGKTYIRVYNPDWDMEDDNYTTETVEQDGYKLTIGVYDNDVDREFIYCKDNTSLYHDEAKSYPKNNLKDIESLLLTTVDESQDDITASDDVVNEFLKVISKKPKYSIEKTEKYYYTFNIFYKDYPAVNCYGLIVLGIDGNYYIEHTEYIDTEDDLEIVDEYYPIDANSILLDYIQ